MRPNLRRQSIRPRGFTAIVVCAVCLTTAVVDATRGGELPTPSVDELRDAVQRAVPLLLRGGAGYMAERKCFACHSQTMPVMASAAARNRGFDFEAAPLEEHADFIIRSLERGRAKYAEGTGQGGNVITAGYALWTLELAGREANETTAMVVDYLLDAHAASTHWRVTTIRPPAEGSHFAATFVALRAVHRYGNDEQKQRAAPRWAKVRTWLETTEPTDAEDRVFRLRALGEIGADAELVRAAADALVAAQRDDGGWAQQDDGTSDAYATGAALAALYDTRTRRPGDDAYRRGLRYLLDTQRPDGSWHVRSRSKPIQTYFESGFPHDKDQFISIAATGWAATAIAAACPTHVPADER